MGRAVDEDKEYYRLIEQVFKVLAPFYDLFTVPLSGLRDKVVEFTGASSGSRILDVATGTGEQALAFARRGYEVIGIDISEAMLRVARGKNRYRSSLRFEAADATSLPFGDGSFDVTCICFALHDMPLNIREKALREIVRVTMPAGLVVIADYALPGNKIGRSLVYHLVSLYEGKYYVEFIESDLEALLRATGIEIRDKLRALHGTARLLKGIRTGRHWLSGIYWQRRPVFSSAQDG